MSRKSSHDEFLELCAVATAGQLTAEEQRRLQEHLRLCSSCTGAMREYEQIAAKAIPAMADQFLSEGRTAEGSDWSENRTEAALLARIEQEKGSPKSSLCESRRSAASYDTDRSHSLAPETEAIWSHVWLQYAAGVLLVVTLGILVYRVGIRRGDEISSTQPGSTNSATRTAQAGDGGPERPHAEEEIKRTEATIAGLQRELAQQSAEVAQLKNIDFALKEKLRERAEGSAQMVQERANIQRQLETAQANSSRLQQKLDSIEQEAVKVSVRAKTLETQVLGLGAQLRERNDTIEQQQELLAHDRDIRELMGARDLYIAEVYDVAGSGTTKKPYGRVFYTKGKSLVFYAYDLDQQKNLKNASTFQAWGQRGQDAQHAVNLGVFYEDNAANRRWILRCDDPKTLAQIDAVFVTVEPNGGSQTPSARKLLFASLKIDPNHP